jgi:neopullulanase
MAFFIFKTIKTLPLQFKITLYHFKITMQKIQTIFLFFIIFTTAAFAQSEPVQHICPENWWVGMKNPSLEIMVHQKNIAQSSIKMGNYKGVKLVDIIRTENPNYVFLELQIGKKAAAGKLNFAVTPKTGAATTINYELKPRRTEKIQGVTSADFTYLLMPDRFANGDKNNDIIKGMNDVRLKRDSGFVRHGGDLRGVINHLDYLNNLGVTALWLTPVFENNQPYESYHGYAFTDHYKIDARLGTNAEYGELVDKAHAKGLKIVMDLVHNHIGNRHWLFQDLPAKDWVHQWSEFTRTTYRATTLMDPYASETERKQMSDGWFDKHMPDLNQQNPQLANYFIQNNIWWIEQYGINGFRVDTYAYPDQKFMGNWAKAVLEEYPNFGIFGETWVQGIGVQAFFAKNNIKNKDKNAVVKTNSETSNLPGVTDFQLYYAIQEALSKEMGWTEGIQQLYHTLAVDYVYDNPMKNVVFLDNHDLSRFYSVVKEDITKYKMGAAFLLTTRGMPQWYYGDEILMKNYASLSGVEAREDFPGGWAEDKTDKFAAAGRNEKENEAFNFISKLANYRKNCSAIQTGKLMQFVPTDGVYVFFRYDDKKTVMVIMNTDKKAQKVATKRFAERTKGFAKANNILTNDKISNFNEFEIKSGEVMVLELQP